MCSSCFLAESAPAQAVGSQEVVLCQGASHPRTLQGISRPGGPGSWPAIGTALDLDPGDWDSNPASGTQYPLTLGKSLDTSEASLNENELVQSNL